MIYGSLSHSCPVIVVSVIVVSVIVVIGVGTFCLVSLFHVTLLSCRLGLFHGL